MSSRSIESDNLVATMLRGRFTADETANIAGGNYLRIFRDAVG